MRQNEDKMGMGEIKENEATVNEITLENVEEQPVVYKEYSTEYLVSAVEAILFSIGESVSVDRLAKALEMETKKLSKQMEEVLEIYNQSDRGIKMVELENAYQLCTRNEYYDVLTKVVCTPKKPNLTDVLLETLSIVAYKQPITRPEIEAIRGVSCAHAINKLMEYGLVDEVGRLDAPGRPILFGTTEEFLRSFGVASTEELPMISRIRSRTLRRKHRKRQMRSHSGWIMSHKTDRSGIYFYEERIYPVIVC
ncbi:SMC-Scp complex subunit ScpB [Clostridium sp. AM54-14XD]|uniref:SMC-Scp complex subunit ScpB n=1 Tax=Clostridium sp. AM54-14XD TaxID=2293037 RepID=UPI0032B86AD9